MAGGKYRPPEIRENFPFEGFADESCFVSAMIGEFGAAIIPECYYEDVLGFGSDDLIRVLLPVVDADHVEIMITSFVDDDATFISDVGEFCSNWDDIKSTLRDCGESPGLLCLMDANTNVPCCDHNQRLEIFNRALLNMSTLGKIRVLELAKHVGIDPDISILLSAITSGHEETVEWFLHTYPDDQRYRLHPNIVDQAVELGHVHVVRALVEGGYKWENTTKIMSLAVHKEDEWLAYLCKHHAHQHVNRTSQRRHHVHTPQTLPQPLDASC